MRLYKNDTINLGPYTYKVLDIKDGFALFEWTESTGVSKQRWVKINLVNAA